MPSTATERIAEMIEPSLEALGYELVRVRLMGGGKPVLQVMAERGDDRSMTVDDCAEISRAISALLDVEDPLEGAYDLEVSSPGIDRPLVKRKDFERFAGSEATVKTTVPIDGRRRFRGRLLGMNGDKVRLALADGGEAALAFETIEKAKLVMPENLFTGRA